MSTFEASITNSKKQLEFYKQLSEKLQQENKILKENAENNDKVVDKVNWENMLLKKENKQLKLINKEYERLDNGESRGCTITRVDEYDIYDLIKCKDNWNKLKEWVKMEHREDAIVINLTWKHATGKFLDKMQELEQGSDSNDSN